LTPTPFTPPPPGGETLAACIERMDNLDKAGNVSGTPRPPKIEKAVAC